MAVDAFGIVGTVIASAYHVESVVAEGGFGTVYRAHHGGFRAPVALKCLRLPPGLAHEARQHFLESFRAEAELLFRLSASIPTVVRPLHVDAFTAADGRFVPYMVLEWLEGSTLDALIRKRRSDGQAPFALKKLVRLLTPVARALERAHNFQGPEGPVSVVHRDLKPENIFVAKVAGEEVVKILDFGIGKAKSVASQVAGRASQGAAGIATFTPAYGSPEQWAPKRYGQTGPWTDVWGLALTLTEALVGHPIIDGDPAAIMGTILDASQRPTPGSEGVIISDEVEQVFSKALALDPRDRYLDAGVFWNELLAAARITSGEVQEVRLPRDARAEPGGGLRVERVEVRKPSTRLPAVAQPPSAHPVAGGLPTAGTSGVAEEFDFLPLMPVNAPFPPAMSGSFQVPDLDVAPAPRQAAPQRTSSGLRAAVSPPIHVEQVAPLDLGPGASYDLGPGTSFDLGHDASLDQGASFELDLPSHEPLVRRMSSGGMRAVRPSDPPPASLRTPLPSHTPLPRRPSDPPRASQPPGASQPGRNSWPPDYSASAPPVTVSAAPPAVYFSAPPTAGASMPPAGASMPPVSRGAPGQPSMPPVSRGAAGQPSLGPPMSMSVPAPRPAFEIKLLPSTRGTLLWRLLPGLVVVGAAVLVTLLDQLYSAITGEIFSIGPLRSGVVAGVLMVVGVALGVYRLKRE